MKVKKFECKPGPDSENQETTFITTESPYEVNRDINLEFKRYEIGSMDQEAVHELVSEFI